MVSDDDEDLCCDEYEESSSHYHCARCGERCSMMGHLSQHGGKAEWHLCCSAPYGCELEAAE